MCQSSGYITCWPDENKLGQFNPAKSDNVYEGVVLMWRPIWKVHALHEPFCARSGTIDERILFLWSPNLRVHAQLHGHVCVCARSNAIYEGIMSLWRFNWRVHVPHAHFCACARSNDFMKEWCCRGAPIEWHMQFTGISVRVHVYDGAFMVFFCCVALPKVRTRWKCCPSH